MQAWPAMQVCSPTHPQPRDWGHGRLGALAQQEWPCLPPRERREV